MRDVNHSGTEAVSDAGTKVPAYVPSDCRHGPYVGANFSSGTSIPNEPSEDEDSLEAGLAIPFTWAKAITID